MKNQKKKKIVVRVTPEEMRMLVSSREKRRKKYLKHLKRVKKINKIKRKIADCLYPIKQRLYGAGAIGLGLVGFFTAQGDGEIMFSAVFLIFVGAFILFSRENVFNCEKYYEDDLKER